MIYLAEAVATAKSAIPSLGKGHFRAACRATDQVGVGNTLSFAIDFDQTDLPKILKGLDAVCNAFPVLGAP
jgi:hypothetical protein